MNKTKIEWVKNPDGSPGYTWNPITGCLNHNNGLCKGGGFPCYAYKLANGRLKQRYLGNENIADYEIMTYPRHIECIADPFYPRFWEERLAELPNDVVVGKERGIFVCDMGDLFGIGVPESWTRQVLERIQGWPEYRLYILTKQAARLPESSPFPENCWVGVTATKWQAFSNGLGYLAAIKAKVKYLSFEPLLERIEMDMLQKMLFPQVIDWVIIGACTGTKKDMEELCKGYPELSLMSLCLDVDRRNRYITKWTAQPRIEWVREIVEAADKAGIPVFLKDNLSALLPEHEPFYKEKRWHAGGMWELRQEMPV